MRKVYIPPANWGPYPVLINDWSPITEFITVLIHIMHSIRSTRLEKLLVYFAKSPRHSNSKSRPSRLRKSKIHLLSSLSSFFRRRQKFTTEGRRRRKTQELVKDRSLTMSARLVSELHLLHLLLWGVSSESTSDTYPEFSMINFQEALPGAAA